MGLIGIMAAALAGEVTAMRNMHLEIANIEHTRKDSPSSDAKRPTVNGSNKDVRGWPWNEGNWPSQVRAKSVFIPVFGVHNAC